jgi:transposase
MELYGGIDLHSNNNVLALMNGEGQRVERRRLPNDLQAVKAALAPYREQLRGIVVESTFNWYWLVDGLMEAGYRIHLANTTAIQQYNGLKYSDDDSDALFLAQLLRLGILPEGYIYPRAERGIRDLARKRAHLVRQRTANILSIQNILQRSAAKRLKGDKAKQLTMMDVESLVGSAEVALAVETTVQVSHCLDEQIARLEQVIVQRIKLRKEFVVLQSIPGVGTILALTIMLEAGPIARFEDVGHFSSYCRCVGSTRLSNGKQKGKGNVKNGNRYLAWAFVEAANFAVRYSAPIRRFHERKTAQTNSIVATKAVAHKLARAAYHMLRQQKPFEVSMAFGAH